MGLKEKPTFFNCNCGDHYYMPVSSKMRSEAKNLQSGVNETDTTDARSAKRSEQDSLLGKIAEVAVAAFLRSEGATVEFNDGWMYDLLVNGHKVEVKARDYTQTAGQYADLLVRDRSDTNWSPNDVDYIVQVMLEGENSDKAYITGYCTGSEAASADFFHKAKTHRTRKVSHTSLSPIEDLF